MLSITPTAAEALTSRKADKGFPATHVVRFVTADPKGAEAPRLAFRFVDTPEPGDMPIEEAGIEAYASADVRERAADVTVDAEEREGGMAFVIRS